MLTVGTWNLENLFRPGAEAGPRSEELYEAKLTVLAMTISTLAPDVLAVQEVGNPEALADLVQRLEGTWHGELAAPDGRGIRVGVLSRLPLSHGEPIVDFPAGLRPIQVDDTGTTLGEMARPALRVRVQTGATTVDVVSCHLKSKLLTFPGGRFNPVDEDERARYGSMPSPVGRRKPPRSAPMSPIFLPDRVSTGPSSWPVISTTNPTQRPRSSCTAPRARRSVPPGMTSPTTGMGNGCGTWPR
ncbi:MAG TPA: endonuclease/exonuclease/phosphatase family protein [Pseudonocardiaceae bacterium]|nr:endonuclease/exonuclease/phosphatase family protein [Pseudonocardiaceae bacterium]